MKPLSKLIIVVSTLLLSACASPGKDIVESAKSEKPISVILATCGKLNLTRDCSNWSGATRKLSVGDTKCRVASTADGRTVLIQSQLSHAWFNGPNRSKKTNLCYTEIRAEIEKNGLKISKTIPLGNTGKVAGYIIESDSAIYEVVLKFAKEK